MARANKPVDYMKGQTMNRFLWMATLLMFGICSSVLAAEDAPVKIQKKLAPIKPFQKTVVLPRGSENAQQTTSPQGTVTISVVNADIRANGYTIDVRNDSQTASGPLIVYTFKGSDEQAYQSPGGSLSLQSLAPGATGQISIDQPPGWHTGYELFTVQVREQVGGHEATVGERSYSMPPL